jgi:MFS family permease
MPASQNAAKSGWTAFQYRDFRLFGLTRLFSISAGQIQTVALGWMVYQITGKAFSLGLVGLFIFLPGVCLFLVTGHVADRYDRRYVLSISYAVAAATAMILAVMAMNRVHHMGVIYAMVLLFGIARAFAFPASSSILPNIVSRQHLANAIAWNSSIFQTATIAAPALGGFLTDVGTDIAFMAAALCYALSAVVLLFLKKHERRTGQRVDLTSVLAGFRYIWAEKPILGAISLDLFAVLLGGATALLPIYASDILHVGSAGFGMLRSMPAVGAVLTAFYVARWPLESKTGVKMLIAVVIFGLATVVFGVSRNLPLSLFCLFVMGATDMISVYVRQTLVQIETPDEMRGRVAAVNSVFIGASNELGEFESGTLAAFVGTVSAVVIGGVGTIAVAVLWAWLFPELRDRDRLVLEEEGDQPAT